MGEERDDRGSVKGTTSFLRRGRGLACFPLSTAPTAVSVLGLWQSRERGLTLQPASHHKAPG